MSPRPEPPYAQQAPSPVLYDLDPALLAGYRPEREEPEDFDLFWKRTLAEARRHPVACRAEPVEAGLRTLDAFDVTFAGYDGQAVKGWLVLPRERPKPLPLIVQYMGYGGGRGLPLEHLLWATTGHAHFVMDSRGQGVDTPDAAPTHPASPDGPHVLRGIHDPQTYYYRRLVVDAVRAVDCLRTHPAVNAGRVVVAGTSQGGGLALAAAALAGEVAAVMPDLPFPSHWRRATRLADRGPYAEVARYCATQPDRRHSVFATLGYFDAVGFAARCRPPALFSVALMDRVCPPSTVYAAYNHYAGPKRLAVWEYNDHEGGGPHQQRLQLDFLAGLWPAA